MKRTFWATAVVFTFMTGAACSDSSGPKLPAEVGTYTLATVNSGGLPAVVFQNSAGRIVILGATMLLREDKSYLETRNYNTVLTTGESSPTTITENGTYGVVGTQITFTIPASGSNAALSYTGAVSNGKLTYTYSGISYQYQK